MKPPEILSMIEEATGTSMYESKKESAQRMIEKKENKLTQINKVCCKKRFLLNCVMHFRWLKFFRTKLQVEKMILELENVTNMIQRSKSFSNDYKRLFVILKPCLHVLKKLRTPSGFFCFFFLFICVERKKNSSLRKTNFHRTSNKSTKDLQINELM